jgi:serine protease Do
MSLFDDDFYSTKVFSGKNFGVRANLGWRGVQGGLILFAAVFFLAGMLTTSLLFMSMSNDYASEPAEPVFQQNLPPMNERVEHGEAHSDEKAVRAIEAAGPAVVTIMAEGKRLFGLGEPGNMIGSGIIFEKTEDEVYIVTNAHVVQDAENLKIVLSDGTKRNADIIGSDAISDLAVLKTDGEGIEQIAEFGDSDKLKVGQTAIAIGNPLGLGFSQTITVGVISSTTRSIPVSLARNGFYDWEMDLIQTDAAINQGNSGGALVNLDGKVIGINSMKVMETGVEGLGFAIPINQAKPVISNLLEFGKVKRPYMGVYTKDVLKPEDRKGLNLPENVENGIIILDVAGAAKKAGLKPNDVIVAIDGFRIVTTLELRKYLYSEKQIGDSITVTLYREGKRTTVEFKLMELEEEE